MTDHPYSLGTYGIWTGGFQWPSDPAEIKDVAAEIEDLGFGSLWIGVSYGDLALHEAALAGTSSMVVASGIVNVWTEDAAMVGPRHNQLTEAYPSRFMLGLGAGHAAMVEAQTGQPYVKPLSKVAEYLDQLDHGDPPVPKHQRILAALGPKALALAAERSAGAHPYLTTPEHTADARTAIGPSALLVVEQKVFFGTDPEVARKAARKVLAMYLELPNYLNNLRRYGFTDDDFADGGSDRLVDSLVAWGDDAAVRGRLQQHLDAGADHVVPQVLSAGDEPLPRTEWRRAAEVLLG